MATTALSWISTALGLRETGDASPLPVAVYAGGAQQGTPANPTTTQQAQSASFAGSQVSVGTTATLINAAASNARMISNTGTVTVFIGPTTAVTTTSAYPIPVGAQVPVTWMGATYGIVASGTGSIGVLSAA